MDLQIRGNGVTITDGLREYADERVGRFERLVEPIDDARLELRANKTRKGPDTVTAQITLQSGRTLLRAENRDADARVAIEGAADKLDRQVRRTLSRADPTKSKRSPSIRTSPDFVPLPTLDDAEPNGIGKVVRTKRFPVKPMDVDEAVEQMELLGHDFFLFQNQDGTHSVVYRRRDGDYGLIVPEPA